jgi:hypothetical protein
MLAVQDRSDELLDLVRIDATDDLTSVLPQFIEDFVKRRPIVRLA